jgi:hypothetical protein
MLEDGWGLSVIYIGNFRITVAIKEALYELKTCKKRNRTGSALICMPLLHKRNYWRIF